MLDRQLQQQVDDSATRIQQRKAELTGAQQKQRDAKLEVKKLQKDMEEFKNNKEGKIEELRVSTFSPPCGLS